MAEVRGVARLEIFHALCHLLAADGKQEVFVKGPDLVQDLISYQDLEFFYHWEGTRIRVLEDSCTHAIPYLGNAAPHRWRPASGPAQQHKGREHPGS